MLPKISATLSLPMLLLAALLIVFMLIQLVRLRLEVWANRRVIQALEQAGVKPEKKSKSSVPELMAWSVLLLVLFQIMVRLVG